MRRMLVGVVFGLLLCGAVVAFAVEEMRITEGGKTFAVALYGTTQVPSITTPMTDDESRILDEWNLASALAERLGMKELVKQDGIRILRPIRTAHASAMGLTPISNEELALWGKWLPTSYRTDVTRANMYDRPWEAYQFDPIPIAIRERIATIREQQLFEVLEIRTPEQTYIHEDPVFFGWIGSDAYLVARWAESDASLLTIDQLQQGIEVRQRVGGWSFLGWLYAIPAAIVILVAGLFLCASLDGIQDGVLPDRDDLRHAGQALFAIIVAVTPFILIRMHMASIQSQFPYAF